MIIPWDRPTTAIRTRFGWITAALLIATISWSCGNPTGPSRDIAGDEKTPAKPNIVIILSDTHRLDYVSDITADERSRTPNIAALMRDGVAFTEAYTPVPISAPAYASLMTGLRPIEHGLLNNQQHLGSERPLLQERLQRLGYRTAAVVGNLFCTSNHGFGRGFDSYWDEVDGRGKEGEIITGEALRWLDSSTDDAPFFLFVAYMDAHTPYIADEIPPSLRVELNGIRIRDERAENAHVEQRYELLLQPGKNHITLSFLEDGEPATPAKGASPLHLKELRLASGLPLERANAVVPIEGTPYERINNRATLTVINPESNAITDEIVFRCYRKYRPESIPGYYAAGVRSFDRAAGRLLDHLRDRGLYDDSVVIFVSDHGEMLGEHDAWGHVPHLFQETMRIPLIIKAQGLDPGTMNSTRLDLLGLHDIVLELAEGGEADLVGVVSPDDQNILVGATYPPEAGTLQSSSIHGNFKVIVTAEGETRAFDLEADPHEDSDIFSQMEQDPRIQALIAAARTELAAAARAESLDLSALSTEERDQLRALGYLDSGS